MRTIVCRIAPYISYLLQKDGLIDLKCSINDDIASFKNAISSMRKSNPDVKFSDNISYIDSADILLTNYNLDHTTKIDQDADAIKWIENFSEKYLIKYLNVAARDYDDFYYNECRYQNIFKNSYQRIFSPYYYNLTDTFYSVVNYFYSYIKNNDIELLVQHYTPHEPNFLLLYYICKEMGIKIIFLHPIFVENKRYYTLISDIDDIGTFDTAFSINKSPLNLKIEKKHEKEISFMFADLDASGKKVKFDAKTAQEKKYNNLKRLELIEKSLLLFKRPFCRLYYHFNKETLKTNEIISAINGRQGYLFHIKNRLSYYNDLRSVIDSKPDLEKKFIYFPLHFQPELTTMPMGGKYQDQILALEHLSSVLPDGWKIYVKDNPRQNRAMRGEVWFKRFKTIPNTVMIDPAFDTYTLIRKSQCVATITGTVGWEAITGGKTAITFGNPWYKKFEGIFEYRTDLNILEVCKYEIDHNKIQKDIDRLSIKMSDIQIDLSGVDTTNFDFAANEMKFYEILKNAITEYKSH